MKKVFSIIFLSLFVLSIMASASPKIQAHFADFAGEQKFASTHIPVPPTLETNKNLANR